METLPALAVESFSYSWLSNAKDPLDCLVDYEPLRASLDTSSQSLFQELCQKSQNFDFDVPLSHSPVPFNHADELFSHGLIKPLFFNPSKLDSYSSQRSFVPAMPVSDGPNISHLLARWRKSSGRMASKCLRILCGRMRMRMRKSTRVDDVDRIREWEVKSWNNICYNSPRASPLIITTSPAYYDNMESSIYEAVLYCKRSIEK